MVDKSIQEIKSWRIKKLRILETYSNYVVDKHGCICISETPFARIELHLLNDTIYQRILLLKANEVSVFIEKNIEQYGGSRLDEITIQPHTFWQKIFKKAKKEY
jgi:hypothetical protein